MSRVTKCFVLSVLTLSVAAADSLTVVNPSFANVPVQCSPGYAYENPGSNCTDPSATNQDFNSGLGIGWTFASHSATQTFRDGVTNADTAYYPPAFTGLPFSQAAFLQGSTAAVAQTITGFVPGGSYVLSFYLGSRYGAGCCDGNQTVQASLDGQVIGTWNLVDFTPFGQQMTAFTAEKGGPQVLKLEGTAKTGDQSSFFSDVSIQTAGSLTVQPSSGEPGIGIVASAAGFAPFETVNLIAYASAPVPIGTATADSTGAASVTGRIPQTPYGALGLQAVGQTSGAVASGTITLRPRLSVSPNTGVPGTIVAVTGFGFAAGETVAVIWSAPQSLLGSATANRNGTISGQFAIPAAAQPGNAQVLGRGQRTAGLAGAQIIVQ